MAEDQSTPAADMPAVIVESNNTGDSATLTQLNGDAMYLNYRRLQSLPLRLFDASVCSALHRLYLKYNLLQSVPPEIKMLCHLTELYLSNNALKTLPEELGELTQLELLGVSDNQLTSFPECICHLRNLRRLQISRNKLRQLPAGIGDLKQLQALEVSHNRLRWLPPQLSHCANLCQLSVDSNQLVTIPRQLCSLTQLSEISACDNCLVSLPQDLGLMPSLQALYVDNNPYLVAIPASTLHKTIGFCRSGQMTIPDKILSLQLYVAISAGKDEEIIVPMPPEICSLGQICTNCVPSLSELTLRLLFKAIHNTATWTGLQEGEIPAELKDFLETPTAHCQHCGAEIFISAFPVIFRAQVQAYNLVLLGLCCSSTCVRQCSLIVHLPLLYPRLEDLALALVLA